MAVMVIVMMVVMMILMFDDLYGSRCCWCGDFAAVDVACAVSVFVLPPLLVFYDPHVLFDKDIAY